MRKNRLVFLVLPALLAAGCGSGKDVVAEAAGTEATSPRLTTESLRAIWASGPDDAWAVGNAGTLLHHDGAEWVLAPPVTDRDLVAVSGSGPDDVWAVGDDVVLHYDGAEWRDVLSGMSEVLLGVWSTSPGEVWAAGIATDVSAAVLRHWDGQEWAVGVASSAHSFWDVWAVGGEIWTGGTSAAGTSILMRGDGQQFDVEAYPGGAPRAIWGTSTEDVWVVPYAGALQHWDGGSWGEVEGRPPVTFFGMHGSGPEDVWVVGLEGSALHWDGVAISSVHTGTGTNLFGVWASGPDDAWLVGAEGTILRWDGETFEPSGS